MTEFCQLTKNNKKKIHYKMHSIHLFKRYNLVQLLILLQCILVNTPLSSHLSQLHPLPTNNSVLYLFPPNSFVTIYKLNPRTDECIDLIGAPHVAIIAGSTLHPLNVNKLKRQSKGKIYFKGEEALIETGLPPQGP